MIKNISKQLLSLIILLVSYVANAQMLAADVEQQCEIKFAKFIQKGNDIVDTVQGDYNVDGKVDIVLITEDKKKPEVNRTLIILENTGDNYKLVAKTNKAIMCASCGGVFGDPFADISLKRNILTIDHYGGSSWRWAHTYTFRFQKDEWQLIGISVSSFHNIGCEDCDDVSMCSMTLSEINFSTKKMHVQSTKEGTCKIIKDVWSRLSTVPKVTVQNFDCENNYFKK
jgi:hypothetical protein